MHAVLKSKSAFYVLRSVVNGTKPILLPPPITFVPAVFVTDGHIFDCAVKTDDLLCFEKKKRCTFLTPAAPS